MFNYVCAEEYYGVSVYAKLSKTYYSVEKQGKGKMYYFSNNNITDDDNTNSNRS